MNEVLKAIELRRSIRDYAPDAVTDEALNALMRAAEQAPSAMNRQPYHFTFVRDRALLKEFSKDAHKQLLKRENLSDEMKDERFDILRGAPMVCFIFTIGDGPFVKVDAGIAVENLALAAHALDLGSVILGMPRDVFMGEDREKWLKKLNAPEGGEFSIAIGIGKPRSGKDAHSVREGLITVI